MDGFGHLGRFELLDELGRGAMARVWRAWDPERQTEVAIKEPLFDQRLTNAMQSEMGRRFASEARVAMQLSHPGIVRVYETGVWDGRPAIVMELVQGETLAKRLQRGPMDAGEALDVLCQLLDAAGYAHGCGVVHRDIKPDNIFLARDGIVKLADFGIARVEGAATTVGTISGTVLGTPGYLSPEQALGRTADARSDLFSVGVIAYEMLAGFNPFMPSGPCDATTLLYRIVHEPVPELPAYVLEGLPYDLRPVIARALSKEPSERPQTAAEFRTLLCANPLSHDTVPYGGNLTYRALVPPDVAPTVVETLESTRQVWLPSESEASGGHDEPQRRPADEGPRRGWLPILFVLGAMVVLLVLFLTSAGSGAGGGAGGSSTLGARQVEQTLQAEAVDTDGSDSTSQDGNTAPQSQGLENGGTTSSASQTQAGPSVEEQVTESQGEPISSSESGTAGPAFDHVDASSVLASDGSVEFRAANAVDGDASTAWGEGVNGSGCSTVGFGSGESLWLTANSAHEVHGIRIMGGYACDEDSYARYNRCRSVYVALSDGTLFEAELADAYRQYQTIDFNGTYQTTFVYVSLGATVYEGSEFDSTMISEIQVY